MDIVTSRDRQGAVMVLRPTKGDENAAEVGQALPPAFQWTGAGAMVVPRRKSRRFPSF
jgi:hypothetical protein